VSNHRIEYLRQCIDGFLAQTYPNTELVLVSFDESGDYAKLLKQYDAKNIRLIKVDQDQILTLGELRNLSIKMASGEYFCNWDDDDWSHIDRLKIQYQMAEENFKDGSVLAYCLMFDKINHAAYLSHPMFHPATLVCKRQIVTEDICYPSLNINEDDVFIKKLYRENVLYPVVNPILYIYVYHGNNTWNQKHFKQIFSRSYQFSKTGSRLIGEIISHKYSNEEASRRLSDPSLLREFDFFKVFTMISETAETI
jgi:glycosyltransferase involved in cell wall biosynthesis